MVPAAAQGLVGDQHRHRALPRRPALSWWEGKIIAPGYGQGEAVIVDSAYRELTRVRAGNGARMDMHELQITPEGTALFFCYPRVVAADLSPMGGPAKGRVLESVFQELDLRSGRVLLEWRSLDHIPLADSYKPPADPWDYVHLNSIRVAPDGNLLVSARHTWAGGPCGWPVNSAIRSGCWRARWVASSCWRAAAPASSAGEPRRTSASSALTAASSPMPGSRPSSTPTGRAGTGVGGRCGGDCRHGGPTSRCAAAPQTRARRCT